MYSVLQYTSTVWLRAGNSTAVQMYSVQLPIYLYLGAFIRLSRSCSHKQKYTMTFSAEDHAKVGNYAAENGVTMAQKHFKQLNLSETTVR